MHEAEGMRRDSTAAEAEKQLTKGFIQGLRALQLNDKSPATNFENERALLQVLKSARWRLSRQDACIFRSVQLVLALSLWVRAAF